MQKAKIEVIKFGVDGFPIVKEIDNDLEAFYKEIGCDTIQGLTNTEIGHLYGLDVFLDDNGKLYGQDTITGLFVRNQQVVDFLVGNLLILRHDSEGDSVSVNDIDLAVLAKHIISGESLTLPPDSKWKVAPSLLLLKC